MEEVLGDWREGRKVYGGFWLGSEGRFLGTGGRREGRFRGLVGVKEGLGGLEGVKEGLGVWSEGREV